MSGAEKTAPNAREKAVGEEIATRLTAFDRHRQDLLDLLRKDSGPKTEPFDEDNAWRVIRFIAWIYLRREAKLRQEKAGMPNAQRVELLRRLEDALGKARREASEAMKVVRGHWFEAWAEANGNPDFTAPTIYRVEEEFERTVACLKALEEAAHQAAGTVRRKRGRPPGTTVVPPDFILNLESVYRNITKGNAGAGSGPFSRFVWNF